MNNELLKQLAEKHKKEIAMVKAKLLAEELYARAKLKADIALSDSLTKAKESFERAKKKAEQIHEQAITHAKSEREDTLLSKSKLEGNKHAPTSSDISIPKSV
jgi:hypothetical protein